MIYGGPMHIKSHQLWQKQREYCNPRSLLAHHIPFSSWCPAEWCPCPQLKNRLFLCFPTHSPACSFWSGDIKPPQEQSCNPNLGRSSVPTCPPWTSQPGPAYLISTGKFKAPYKILGFAFSRPLQ